MVLVLLFVRFFVIRQNYFEGQQREGIEFYRRCEIVFGGFIVAEVFVILFGGVDKDCLSW